MIQLTRLSRRRGVYFFGTDRKVSYFNILKTKTDQVSSAQSNQMHLRTCARVFWSIVKSKFLALVLVSFRTKVEACELLF